ncbi:16S rRNA (guanine(966)-N(2))-methyltransferase RsmD [Terriglobus sp. RCC_193]|uniref:16S rRNA (guanine(966)-N(2))-methyltransferase RsmD n=1 Tax=Terriglobus sp. RCC_193 TaxID=3239218 RepID=UPI003525ACAA
MRVIAGTYRSRVLAAPKGLATRPTSDRLRETLFNVIAARVPGAVFADLYAGSGAVGIESISRGAAEVFFAEKHTAALSAIRGNLRTLGIAGGFQVEAGGTAPLLKRLAGKPLDLVFLDPPYDEVEEYRKTLTMLGDAGNELVNADSLVIAEHTRKQVLQDRYGVLQRTRTLVQGDAALSFYAVESLD